MGNLEEIGELQLRSLYIFFSFLTYFIPKKNLFIYTNCTVDVQPYII